MQIHTAWSTFFAHGYIYIEEKKQQQYLQIQSREESPTVYVLTRKQSRQSETNFQEIYSRILCFLSTLINLPLA